MDSVSVCIFGCSCTWWHSRLANDVVVCKLIIFSKKHNYKKKITVNLYGHIFLSLDVGGGRKQLIQRDRQTDSNRHTDRHRQTDSQTDRQAHTHTHTHTPDNYSNPRCASAQKVINT